MPKAAKRPGLTQALGGMSNLQAMTRTDLRKILISEGFRGSSYSLTDGYADEALCIRQEPEGWSVFYSERGLETGKTLFSNEAAACQKFLEMMRSDPTTKLSWKGGWPRTT